MSARTLLLAAGLATLGLMPATPPRAQGTADVDVNHGRFVALGGQYREASVPCIQCHGLDGAGDSSGAFPRLSDQSAWYLYKSLEDYAAGIRHNEVMTPIARALSTREMQDVAAFYAAIEDAPYPPKPEVDARTLQIGGAITAVGIPEQGVPPCASCHGPQGVGAEPIYPFIAGQHAAYLERQLLLWKEGRRDGDPLDVMERIARQMTEEQIRAVSLYLASVRPEAVTPDEPGATGLRGRPERGGDPARPAMGVPPPDGARGEGGGGQGAQGMVPTEGQDPGN